ncbi:MAG: hypothetical protein M3396_08755 [Actinomycetota bacterium]|nr:hypothetical protein [Actinomycetota bacterium]MDQ3573932.1 hypothetical protein [Actinomycetota bacterium]
MVMVRVLVFALGLVLVLGTLASAVRTMVVPRALPGIIARFVFASVRQVLRALGGRSQSYERRDRVMAYFAPLGLLLLPGAWLTLALAGYSCMYWGLGSASWRSAFNLSGSSLLTLGTASSGALPELALSFTEAMCGVGLLALLITYLPSQYTTFNRREVAVALLEVRAGTPPSGPNMIERYHRINWDGGLTQVWKDWETWFADLEESHTSLPALSFFRSPQPERSWVTAAGAVLDAASLRASTVEGPRDPEAELCVRAGYVALRRIADFFAIPHDPDPAPHDPISVSKEEFHAVCERLERVGVALKADRDRAWRDFAGWRVNYDRVLVELAGLTMAPQAPWSSDRAPAGRRPRLFSHVGARPG